MQSGILPFRPVLRDFIRNLWYLRFFLFLIVNLLFVFSVVLVFTEGQYIAPGDPLSGQWSRALGITVKGFLFGFEQGYVPFTLAGRTMQIIVAFIRPILFSVLVWVVQQSLSGHTLKRSKYVLFPTEEDF